MSSPTTILLELQYLPPIQYFTKLASYDKVLIEKCENYSKASYRNRCHIAGANGLLRLSIPLASGKNEQQPITKVKVSEDTPWRAQHWRGIKSAYGSSPFWEFYSDELEAFFKAKETSLFDFNWGLLELLIQLIGIDTKIEFTDVYMKTTDDSILDFRSGIHPKKQKQKVDHYFESIAYPQVFEDKLGFMPNLSILDLLFCSGPETILKLEEMSKFEK